MTACEADDAGLPRTTFIQALWGFSVDYPAAWVHQSLPDGETLARAEDALAPRAEGPLAGHIIVSAEWNGVRREIGPIWTDHVARVASMLGARRVQSAPWRIGAAEGMEAEVVLPAKHPDRLWLGILSHELIVLKFLVSHPQACRAKFEPQATTVLRSLRFLEQVPRLPRHACGLPLPPRCTSLPASAILEDMVGPGSWEALATPHSMGALQAFYWREARAADWEVTSFQPYPGNHSLPFARVGLHKRGTAVALGILPGLRRPSEGGTGARLALHWRQLEEREAAS
jgi:hypothetical protein